MMTEAGRKKLDDLRVEQLDLFEDRRLPWEGRSPRVLTRAFQKFSFRLETATIEEGGDDE